MYRLSGQSFLVVIKFLLWLKMIIFAIEQVLCEQKNIYIERSII